MSNHEMLVRVAKAISGQDDAGWAALPADDRERLYGGGKWHDAGRTRADYLDDARAALLSLRELTPDVVEAGCNAIENAEITYPDNQPPFFNSHWQHEARDAFTAMINTIIGESA